MKREKQTALCRARRRRHGPQAASATDGYFANGYGMKSIGMGGAAVAVAQEPFGGAVNPGAMSFLGNEWQLGVVVVLAATASASRTGSGLAGIDAYVDSGSTNFFIPEFGVNWRYSPHLAFGVTVYGNGGMNTDYPGGQISNAERVHGLLADNPVGAVQPALRQRQSRRRPDAADDRAVRVVAIRSRASRSASRRSSPTSGSRPRACSCSTIRCSRPARAT